jgi:hypothetical protein
MTNVLRSEKQGVCRIFKLLRLKDRETSACFDEARAAVLTH